MNFYIHPLSIRTWDNTNNFDIIKFNQYIYAMNFHVENIQEITDLDLSSLIQESMFNLVTEMHVSVDDLENEISKVSQKYFSQAISKFYLVIPTNIIHNSLHKRHFEIIQKKKNKVKIFGYSSINKKFDLKDSNLIEDLKENKEEHIISENTSYFVIEGYDRSEKIFLNSSIKKYEELRSVINFVREYRRTHFTNRTESISLINPPKIHMIFNGDGKYISTKRNNVEWPKKYINFEDPELKSRKIVEGTDKVLSLLNSIQDHKLRNLFLLALEVHTTALDNFDNNWVCCFSFWQIIEILFLCDEAKSEKIHNRILFVLGSSKPFYDIFKLFAKKRHSYVHKAKYDNYSVLDIVIIKQTIEFLLYHLLLETPNIKNYDNLKSLFQSIDFYFNETSIRDHQMNKKIQTKKDMLEYFENSKNLKGLNISLER